MFKSNIKLLMCAAFLGSGFSFQNAINRISFDFEVKTLKDGKYVTLNGQVYCSTENGKMVTRFTKPAEQIVITNAAGQFRSYDPKNNTILQDEGMAYSSSYSFFYSFLSGKTQDMGLGLQGYTLKNTKSENNMIITTWRPKPDVQGLASKVELVHEQHLPIYMCFYDQKEKPEQKIYYSNYQKTGTVFFPLIVTEFDFIPKGDSVITKRIYANSRINQNVSNEYLDYIIPANAKIISQGR